MYLLEWLKLNRLILPNVKEDAEKLEPSYTSSEKVIWYTLVPPYAQGYVPRPPVDA